MAFLLGVDGGATKTLAVVGDDEGGLMGRGQSGAGNYQLIGLDAAMKSVRVAVEAACAAAGWRLSDLAFAALGLAGADRPVDFEELERGSRGLFGAVPFRVLNDTWVGLRGGTRSGWGAVSISGSGSNSAARSRDGRQAVLHAMGYETGNRGGAADIVRDAMHWAFKSLERCGPKTRLETEIPKQLGYKDLDEMMSSAYSYEDMMGL
ncbi:MAG TPA: BadF/BadG/BcrA/BcrD ATPase family protein, partial [Bacillota bacterium]